MENDEETQSHQSGGSGSPESPRSNGRITVTVASAPPQNTLTLALPIQQSRPGGASGSGGVGSGGGGREDCWSEEATAVLIEAWGERYMELSRGNLKQKHWKDVADIVSSREDYRKTPKTDIQCKNRIDTVKKKYKLEKSKIAAGQGPSKWPFYEKLDQLIGPTAKINPTVAAGVAGPSNLYSGNQQVPMGIPMGVRSLPQLRQHQQLQKQKQPSRKRPHMDSDTSESESEPELSPASTDSFPPGTFQKKRPRFQKEMLNSSAIRQGGGTNSGIGIGIGEGSGKEGGNNNWGNSVRELTRAILKFGEAYEQTESAKLQQMMEMEKQRMKFAKEMELQRMQFFMNTQLEISQLKHRRTGNSNHHSNNHAAATSNHNNNNSDSSI